MAIPKVGDVITLDGAPWTGNWSPLAGEHPWIVIGVRQSEGYIYLVLCDMTSGQLASREATGLSRDNEWPLMNKEIVIDPFLSAVHQRRQLPQSQPN